MTPLRDTARATSRHAVPLDAVLDERGAAGEAEESRDRYQSALTAAGLGPITTEISAPPHVLLRRGLPPAVPREGAERLRLPRQHRCRVPRRLRRGLADALG